MSQSYGSSYGGSNPPVTNNPFIQNASHPSNRYPDLDSPPTQQSQPQWTASDPTLLTSAQQQYHPNIYQQYPTGQHQQIPSGYPPPMQQQPPFPPQQRPQIQAHQQPSQPPQNYPAYQQSQPQTTAPYQPSSSFGQNLQASVSGSSYGYLQSHPPPPQQSSAYNPAQQQLLNNPNYIPQFDPLAVSQGWASTDKTAQSQSQSQSIGSAPNKYKGSVGYGNDLNQTNSGPVGFSSSGAPHPRDYIRSNKEKIEAWDSYTWKQLLSSCEALKKAWEMKRNDLKDKLGGLQAQLKYAGYYDRRQIQLEGGKIEGLLSDAQSNFDSASASTFQFEESFKGYRQSGDTSSKKRVREATNAALQHLPKWPEP